MRSSRGNSSTTGRICGRSPTGCWARSARPTTPSRRPGCVSAAPTNKQHSGSVVGTRRSRYRLTSWPSWIVSQLALAHADRGSLARGAPVLDVDADHRRDCSTRCRWIVAGEPTQPPSCRPVAGYFACTRPADGSWRDELTQDQRIRASTPVLRRCGEFEPRDRPSGICRGSVHFRSSRIRVCVRLTAAVVRGCHSANQEAWQMGGPGDRRHR